MFDENELTLLAKIRAMPALYLHKISVMALRDYMAGYWHAKDESMGRTAGCVGNITINGEADLGKIPPPQRGFLDFVQDYYTSYREGYFHLISHMSANEEEAFWKFFELLDAYLASEKSL